LKELTFDWLLGAFNLPATKNAFASGALLDFTDR